MDSVTIQHHKLTSPNRATTAKSALPADSARLNWAVALLSGWMIGGVHLDAWAHHRFPIETFFTPWHAVLYSGYLAVAFVLVGRYIQNLRQGYDARRAMPTGYGLSLIGAALFALGGVGDMLWHTWFGIEVNIEALVSPTHLLLALGGALIATGPLRAAWHRDKTAALGWAETVPVILSLTWLLAVLAFFTAYVNPLTDARSFIGRVPPAGLSSGTAQALGMSSILVQTALVMGVILLALRRWTLPAGSLTSLLTLYGLLALSIHENWYLLPFVFLSGVAADLLAHWLKPSQSNGAYRLFALAMPIVFNSLYFALLALAGGVWWRIHMWAGAIVMAGIVGWLLSYAFVPPRTSAEARAKV